MQMFKLDSHFAGHLKQLRILLLGSVATQAFRDMTGLIAIALARMDKFQIKTLSYQGAVARKVKNGWTYSDPGNFIYSLWWLLTGMAAKHWLKDCARKRKDDKVARDVCTVCNAFLACQKRLVARWPKQKDSPQMSELIGDIVEMVLACSHIDNGRYWPIQTQLGPVIQKVQEFVWWIEHEAHYERQSASDRDALGMRPFFSGMRSRCECASRLAMGMFHAAHVQKHRIDVNSIQFTDFVLLGPELRLMYPTL